jgi:hypothetical protein
MNSISSVEIAQANRQSAMDRPLVRYGLLGLFWVMGLAMGVLHAWTAARNYSMNADGIAYLDIGDAYMRGDWTMAVNPVWSPLYSWILGTVMALVKPSMKWEFPLVHWINFVIFVGAFLSFEFFWRQLGRYRKEVVTDEGLQLPTWAWLSLGYVLFIWSTLTLIAIWAVTPDMLMAIFVLLAAGLIVRLRFDPARWSSFALLGLVLGFGYLAKTIMFPLAFVFLTVALLTPGNLRRSIPRTAVALLVFLLISLPYVALISGVQGHFTFGEGGTITYLRHVNGIPYPHWPGDPERFGTLVHPSRPVFNDPPIYEFGEPIGGTYPISYNPIYWYQGVTLQFNLEEQLRTLVRNSLYYCDLFLQQQGGLLMGILLLALLGRSRYRSLWEIPTRWGLLLIALSAFAIYSLVYVEGRYIGVFVLLFWADWLANIRLPYSPQMPRLVGIVSLAMIGFMLANLLVFNLEGYNRLLPSTLGEAASEQRPPMWPGEVAETLWQSGIMPGDSVAVIGYGFDSYWARLAKLKIVAEMSSEQADPFWLGELAFQQQVIKAFAGTGAKAIVAEYVPSYARLSGWQRVGNSSFYIYLLTNKTGP